MLRQQDEGADPAGAGERRRMGGQLRAETMHLLDALERHLAVLREDGQIDYSGIVAECDTLVGEIRAQIEGIEPDLG
jgi:hypothetical protein